MAQRLRWIALLAAAAVSLMGEAVVGSSPEPAHAGPAHGLEGRYFDTERLTAPKLTRVDRALNFDWRSGSPHRAIRPETFSARWRGSVSAPSSGVYTFYARTSDGVRLWVDGKLVIDRWRAQQTREWSGRIRLVRGRRHTIRIDYFERSGQATARLLWAGPGVAKQVIPSSRLYPPAAAPAPAACGDKRDNDGDDKADHPRDPGCTSASDGSESPDPAAPGPQRWSSPATWGSDGVPRAGDTVTIPAGKTVLLDRSTPALAGLRVDGTLIFDNADLTLTSDWVMVHGELRIGTPAQPFSRRGRVVLTGSDRNQNVMGMGPKVLGVMGGTLNVHGEPRTGWTRLGATAAKGATRLTLAENPGWRAGDRIAIASTDYGSEQAEEATVTSASGTTVNLDRPLGFAHYGERQTIDGRTVDERAEVALLNRNVTIEGEASSSASGFGGQMMVMNGGKARIENAELTRMGQKNVLRRYPIHFHMLGNGGADSRVEGSSIHHTFNRCMTIHGTNRVRIAGNTCYDHVGHGFFLEDGAETDNVLEGNLGFRTRKPAAGERLIPSDANPATFWITNPDNEVRRNVAGGSDGFGFWYALPEHPTGLSADDDVWPRRTPLGQFADNIAHSNGLDGLQVDGGPKPDGYTEAASYDPRANPAPPPAGQPDSPSVEARFERLTAYKNRQRGVWTKGANHRVVDSVLADNAIGVTLAASSSALSDSLVVGETANIGNRYPWDMAGTDGRALPQPWRPEAPVRGFEFYDGRVGAERTTFANYAASPLREAHALGFRTESYAFGLSPQNYATAVRFVDAKRVLIPTPVPGKDGDAAAIFNDLDGSVTGVPNAVVTANNPFLAEPSCLADPTSLRLDWNAYVCPPAEYVKLIAGTGDGDPAAIHPLRITRAADAKVQTLFGAFSSDTSATSPLLPDREYGVDFSAGTPEKLRFRLYRGSGRWLVLSVPYAVEPKVTKSGCDLAAEGYSWCKGRALSREDLDSRQRSAYWYDAANGRLYLKLVAVDTDWEALDVEPRAGG